MNTQYPWKGSVSLKVSPETATRLAIKVRIPNWALGTGKPSRIISIQLEISRDAESKWGIDRSYAS